MPEGEMSPAQARFFAAHINKGLLGKLRNKKDMAFAAAFRAFTDAEKTVQPLLTNLPMYPNGSAELAEKNAIIVQYNTIITETLAQAKNSKTAIAACLAGAANLAAISARAAVLMDKALVDTAIPDPDRVVLLKQRAALHLNSLRDGFATRAAPVLASIAARTDTPVAVPMSNRFDAEIAALHGEIAAVPPSAQTADALLAAIMAKGDALFAKNMDDLSGFDGSPALQHAIDVAQLDAALRSALALAKSYADQMVVWNVADAQAFATDVQALAQRGATVMAATDVATQTDADRAVVQAEADALNTRAAKAIEDKKKTFGQMFRDVEARFATVERAFRDIDDVTFAKGQKAPIEDVLGLTRTAINDLNGYNTAALVAAKKLVDQAATIVSAAQNATDTNAKLKDTLKKLDADIDKGCKKGNPLAAQFTAHKQHLTELSATWHVMLLPDAAKAIQTFQARVTADLDRATALDLRRTTARADLATARADLALFNTAYGKLLKAHGRKVKPYAGDVVTDLDTAEGWIETKTALSFYDTIDIMLARARATIAALLIGLQSTEDTSDDAIFAEALALQREMEDATQQTINDMAAKGETPDLAALANARASVEAQIAKLSTRRNLLAQDIQNDHQNAEEANRKEAYLAEARSFLKTTKDDMTAADPASALAQSKDSIIGHLACITASIQAVEKGASARPAQIELDVLQKTIAGIKARGPNSDNHKLTDIGTEWAAAVNAFQGKCAALLTAVETYLSDNQHGTDYAPQLATLTKALTNLQSRLDPAGFVRVAHRFADPAQVKAAREDALQRVRYFNDLLLSDPVVQQCALNPFGIRDFASPIAQRLRQIELNVLRAA